MHNRDSICNIFINNVNSEQPYLVFTLSVSLSIDLIQIYFLENVSFIKIG